MSKNHSISQSVLPKLTSGQYYFLMRSWANLDGFEANDTAKFRFKVISHCYDFGWKAATAAFNVPKSTLFDWKRIYEKSGKKLNSLVPKSTKPKNIRLMQTSPSLVSCIKSIREQYGRVGKLKIKPLLDAYASSLGIPGYGYDKINKIVVRNHYFFDSPKKRLRVKTKLLSPRVKHSPKITIPGYVEIDSITIWIANRRYYFITAIDIVTRVAWCKLVKSLCAQNSQEAAIEFLVSYQIKVTDIQTDNGHEFLGEFDQYLQQNNINHHFIYPRSPRINGYIERFNRTIQDEFLTRSDDLFIGDLVQFEERLNHYLFWYNTKRPHQSLKLLSPTQYLQQFI